MKRAAKTLPDLAKLPAFREQIAYLKTIDKEVEDWRARLNGIIPHLSALKPKQRAIALLEFRAHNLITASSCDELEAITYLVRTGRMELAEGRELAAPFLTGSAKAGEESARILWKKEHGGEPDMDQLDRLCLLRDFWGSDQPGTAHSTDLAVLRCIEATRTTGLEWWCKKIVGSNASMLDEGVYAQQFFDLCRTDRIRRDLKSLLSGSVERVAHEQSQNEKAFHRWDGRACKVVPQTKDAIGFLLATQLVGNRHCELETKAWAVLRETQAVDGLWDEWLPSWLRIRRTAEAVFILGLLKPEWWDPASRRGIEALHSAQSRSGDWEAPTGGSTQIISLILDSIAACEGGKLTCIDQVERTVFFSWQMDTSKNRPMLQKALAGAISRENERRNHFTWVLDSANRGVKGSNEIVGEIYKKIEKSSLFVGDVTGTRAGKNRVFSNPNVMLELGYAAKTISWENIVLVANTAEVPLKDLPFDIRNHSIIAFRPAEEKKLQDTLIGILRKH